MELSNEAHAAARTTREQLEAVRRTGEVPEVAAEQNTSRLMSVPSRSMPWPTQWLPAVEGVSGIPHLFPNSWGHGLWAANTRPVWGAPADESYIGAEKGRAARRDSEKAHEGRHGGIGSRPSSSPILRDRTSDGAMVGSKAARKHTAAHQLLRITGSRVAGAVRETETGVVQKRSPGIGDDGAVQHKEDYNKRDPNVEQLRETQRRRSLRTRVRNWNQRTDM